MYNILTGLCNKSVSIIYWEEAYSYEFSEKFNNDTIFEVWMT